ncbi:MAG: hypothetical protein HDR05_16020 [Lachnospiraceae bacterium]|nr:hypothetical protein [Lachnospiraceae bacterium]
MGNGIYLIKMIKRNKENLIVGLLMTFLSFVFLLESPLHPWIGGDTRTDSGVFKAVAFMMERGYMPYRDSFDHKGPLIYILNWIGNRISAYRGVWVIEFIFMTGTFFVIYKIARLKCSVGSSVLVTLCSGSLLFEYFDGGNFVEEYAMIFIAIALYSFLDYLMNQKVTKIRLLICGAGLGATLLLRANMISVWIVFPLFIFVKMVMEKNWDTLKYLLFWFVSGMCIVIIPILIWLAVNRSLVPFWENYIVFNKIYISEQGGRASFTAKWEAYIYYLNRNVIIISLGAVAYMCTIKEKAINMVYLAYMLITLLFICLSGMMPPHYGIILVPMISYPLAALFGEIEKIEFPQVAQTFSIVLSVLFLAGIIFPNWLSRISSVPRIYENRKYEYKSGLNITVSRIVSEKTDTDDAISVYGNWDLIYVLSDRKHATRYSYQFPIGNIVPEIMEEYMEELHEEQPKIIVVEATRYDDNISDFLNNNDYQLIWSQDEANGALIYMKTTPSI